MKKLKALTLLSIISVLLMLPTAPAVAQSMTITVINGTVPISAETRSALESYLNTEPPVWAAYYAPTFVEADGTDQLISLVALRLDYPEQVWHLEAAEGEAPVVAWIGTLRVTSDGNVLPFSTDPAADNAAWSLPGLSSLLLPIWESGILGGAGGGTEIQWPFDRSAQYGPRGVHGSGDYGTNGMNAVDLLGGNSLGSHAMSARVYASASGDIDYVCADNTSVAVRTHGGSNYFLYAHLLDNANLTNGHSFSKGGVIGSLKSGTFNDTCGWASQGNDIYHVHWMFQPSGGKFKVSNCTITTSGSSIVCGGKAVPIGGWINGGGGVGCDPNAVDDPALCTGTDMAPSFWDGVVLGLTTLFSRAVTLLPEHNSPDTVIRGIGNGIELVFRLGYVFAKGNLNLSTAAAIMLVVLAFKLLLSAFWIIWWLLRALYNALPGAA